METLAWRLPDHDRSPVSPLAVLSARMWPRRARVFSMGLAQGIHGEESAQKGGSARGPLTDVTPNE